MEDGQVNVRVLHQGCHLGHYGLGSFGLSSTGTLLKSIQNNSWNFWPETLNLPQRVNSSTKVDLPACRLLEKLQSKK